MPHTDASRMLDKIPHLISFADIVQQGYKIALVYNCWFNNYANTCFSTPQWFYLWASLLR